MMKIVDEKPFSVQFVCTGCGSTLEAEAEDVQMGHFGGNYGGDRGERRYYVTCPVCETVKFLEEDKVPPKVRNLADRASDRRRW